MSAFVFRVYRRVARDLARGRGAIVLVWLGAVALQAQPARDTTRLGTIVVTADRLPRAIASTTSAVTVIEGGTLRVAGITHLVDALRRVPGVSMARSGSLGAQTSLFLRGGESDYVRLLVDGVPMNDPGGALDLGAITTDNVERIEIVRGPASVLYGSDAVTGVIQVFTRRSKDPVEAHVSLRAGTYNTRTADGTIGFRGEMGGLTLGLARHTSDGMLPFNNAYRNDVFSARGDATVAGMRSVLTARHGDNTFQYPTDGAGAIVDRNAQRGERRLSSSAEFARPIGAHVEGIVSLSALNVRGRTSDPTDGAGDTLGVFAYRASGVVRRRVADARVVVRPTTSHAVSLGIEYSTESQRSADSSNYDVSVNRFTAARVTHAAYAQWVGDAGRVSFSLGGRYDDNDVYGDFHTARAGVSARVWPGARVRGAWGTSFKAPSFFESFSTAFSTGNAALAPERSRSWEAGVEQTLAAQRLQLSATVFDQRFRDLIQYTYISPADPNYFNIAAASARGVEVDARGEVAPGVLLWGSATALRTRVDDSGFESGPGSTFVRGARLLRRPPLTVTAGAQVQVIPRTHVDLAVTRVGVRDDRDFATFPAKPVELRSYTRVDVGGDYTFGIGDGIWKSAALIVRIENASGTDYQEIARFRAPGRVLLAGVRVGTQR